VAVAECGSISKAAERLYTTQPNISKIIRSLENELGCNLFKRTNHGLILNPQGQKLLCHAQIVLRNTEIMFSVAEGLAPRHLGVAAYPSNMISHVLTDYFRQYGNRESTVELLDGPTETVVEWVGSYRCEIGVLYIGHNMLKTFNHWLRQKKLEFHSIARKPACIYVGPNHPFYEKKTIKASELKKLKFIQPPKDYFSMENHLEPLDPVLNCIDSIHPVVTTNSDHASISFLSHTDLCSFGIFLLSAPYQQNEIRALQIEGTLENLNLGYVKHINLALSDLAKGFIDMLTAFIKKSD
jgi:DNA-binding transcriptional LysR family regulator